jgi:hypothetical protein
MQVNNDEVLQGHGPAAAAMMALPKHMAQMTHIFAFHCTTKTPPKFAELQYLSQDNCHHMPNRMSTTCRGLQ